MSGFKPYPAYRDSGVKWLGEVPEHWVLKPIKHLALLNPKKSEFDGDAEQLCSFVPMEKLKTGSVLLDEERPIQEVISGYTYFEDNDVLQAKVTPCFENKNVAIAKGLTNGIGFGSTEINVFRPCKEVSPPFLYYRVQEDSYMSFCTSSMIGAGGLKRVPTEIINNFKVAVPALSEQTQIARFLDHETARIDALIEEQQSLIEFLKEKRQAVISHAVTKGLDPSVSMKDSGVEWLGEVPAHWETNALNKLTVKITNGYVGPTRDILVESGVPYVQATHIKRGVVNFDHAYFVTPEWSRKMGKSILREDDVLIVQTGAGTGDVGVVSSRENDYNCHALIIVRTEKSILSGVFLGQVLQSHFGQSVLFSIRTGGMHPHLNCGEVRFVKIPVPPLREQKEISDFVGVFSQKAEKLIIEASATMDLLQERRSALISAAVTGKIDLRGWQPPAGTPAPLREQETA